MSQFVRSESRGHTGLLRRAVPPIAADIPQPHRAALVIAEHECGPMPLMISFSMSVRNLGTATSRALPRSVPRRSFSRSPG